MTIIRQFVTRGVFIKDDEVLIANKKGELPYFLPGGRVEIGEGYEDALIREIKEELDKSATIIRFLGTIEHSFINNTGTQYYEIGNFFLVSLNDANPESISSNEPELEFQWKRIDELNNINIEPKPVIELIRNLNKKEAFWASTLKKKTL